MVHLLACGLPACMWCTCLHVVHLLAYGTPDCMWYTCLHMVHLLACGTPACMWYTCLHVVHLLAYSTPDCICISTNVYCVPCFNEIFVFTLISETTLVFSFLHRNICCFCFLVPNDNQALSATNAGSNISLECNDGLYPCMSEIVVLYNFYFAENTSFKESVCKLLGDVFTLCNRHHISSLALPMMGVDKVAQSGVVGIGIASKIIIDTIMENFSSTDCCTTSDINPLKGR